MKEILRIINEIASTSSRNDKEYILEREKDNQELKDILYFVYSPYIVTGISSKKISKKLHFNKEHETELTIFDVMEYLKNNNTGKDEDIAYVQSFLNGKSEEMRDFYTKIVTKDLKIGITAETINKIYGNFIPTFSVMLAKKFSEHKDKVKGNFVITTKLDGNRLVIIKENGVVKSFTRQGKQYEGLEEIESDIQKLPIDNIVFDGELIADVEGNSIEVYAETTSKARKKGTNKQGLLYHIFDMLSLEEFKSGKSTLKCIDRKKELSKLFAENELNYCREVKPLYVGKDLSKIDEWLVYANENGWEGLMVNLDKPYVCKRSDSILKVKVFNDADVKVLAVIEGTNKNEGKLGAVTIQFEHNGKLYECNCGSGFTDEERIKYFNNSELILGKIINVGYFEISKNQNGSYGMRFPTFKGVRNDKTEISMN